MICVSIIVLNYNTPQLTLRCVESIINFTTDISYEIIIVDNGSTPILNTNLFPKISPIKFLRSEENIGFSKGNNYGILNSSGKYILLLNSDVELIENSVKACIDRMQKDETIGAITSKILINNKDIQYTASRFPSIWLEIRHLLRINSFTSKIKMSNIYLETAFDHSKETDADWIHGTFFCTRRNIIEAMGGKLPDSFFMYGEDMQWCWKIKKLGYKIHYSPETTVIHYAGGSMRFENEEEKYFEKKFPNTFKVVAMEKGYLYSWLLYFIKAFHLLTLRNKKDFDMAMRYYRFLLGEKKYWLNTPEKY